MVVSTSGPTRLLLDVIRSAWALFVDDVFLVGATIVVIAWVSELGVHVCTQVKSFLEVPHQTLPSRPRKLTMLKLHYALAQHILHHHRQQQQQHCEDGHHHHLVLACIL